MYRLLAVLFLISSLNAEESIEACAPEDISVETFKKIMPSLEDIQREGKNGRIMILEGSAEIAARPYFVAMGALKAGADHVHVFTPLEVSEVAQSFSPDYSVFPYFDTNELPMIEYAVSAADVVVLGPGPTEDRNLLQDVVEICKRQKKALVVNTGAVYDLALNISILKDYPAPGVILMPDEVEQDALAQALGNETFAETGDHVTVLIKGKEDACYSKGGLKWTIKEDTIAKHTEEQHEILAGFLGTFFYYALNSKACDESLEFRRDIASFAAAKLARAVDLEAYAAYGRTTTSTDILRVVHKAFKALFG